MQGQQRSPLVLVAPVDGTVVGLTEVSDPVFSQQIAGPGVAVLPQGFDASGPVQGPGPRVVGPRPVVAPVAGRVVSLLPHAFAVEAADGRTVLVHLGLDASGAGRGTFGAHLEPGALVAAGDRVITWTPDAASAGPTCPLVALQADPDDVELLTVPGSAVGAGDALLRWS